MRRVATITATLCLAATPAALAARALSYQGFTSQGHELAAYAATAVAITPGWLRSEMMLDNFGVTEESWRDALDPARAADGRPLAPADFGLSESPRYVGRAVAALAADPNRARWNQRSVSSGQLAREYGFTDVDGSQPDIWQYFEQIRERAS